MRPSDLSAYNPSIWELRQEQLKLEARLGYIARPVKQNKTKQ
jgi:hypothetical protein